jgi:hypothetical protein
VKYELGSYIPEDDILHSHRREHLKSYILNITIDNGHKYCAACEVPIFLKKRRLCRYRNGESVWSTQQIVQAVTGRHVEER